MITKKSSNQAGENSAQDVPLLPRTRGIYLLPNLFTTAGLFSGFLAIIAAMKGHFDTASIAVFVAMMMDALDGRVARLTHTQTAFGAEYDSLSDMVAFGVAPALMLYTWALANLGKAGALVAFIYAAAGALRLARFNTQVQNADKRYFQGLAITAAAGIVASIVWVGRYYFDMSTTLRIFVLISTLCIAALMVSNIRYHSFKEIDMKGKIRFFTLLVIVITFVAIAVDPPLMLFIIFAGYGLSGPTITLMRLRQARLLRRRARKNAK